MYRLTRFGTVRLDYYNQVDPIGSGETPTSYQALPEGGALDGFGSATKHPGAVERVKRVRVYGTTRSQLEERIFEILAMRGKREQLFRYTPSGMLQWQYARLMAVEGENDYSLSRYKLFQDLALRFISQEASWHGVYHGLWTLDSGIFLDTMYYLDSTEIIELASSPLSFTFENGSSATPGRSSVRSMQIIVKTIFEGIQAGTLSIYRTGGETLEFAAEIPPDSELVINTGTMQVTLNSNDAYNDLVFSPGADLATWFSLEPGVNTITVEHTKNPTLYNPTIEFSYYEAWY